MIYIGVDPGKKGAFTIIDEDGEIKVYPWSNESFILQMRRIYSVRAAHGNFYNEIACVEHVSAMPGQGVVSMFNFGQNFGFIQGVLSALGIPYELVRPQKWKKEFSVTKDKNTSIEVCKHLFQSVSLKRTEKCKKDDDGMAESVLLAEYARRKFGR